MESSSVARADFYSEHARKIGNLPPEWKWFHIERLPHLGECQTILIRGAIAPAFTRGKRKGQTNWRARDKATEREFYITPAQHKVFLAEWEQSHGACYHCQGSCQELARWSVDRGTEYRPCSRCKATGKPPQEQISQVSI
jgi:hypothetical protein